jgi:Methyltransferase domain
MDRPIQQDGVHLKRFEQVVCNLLRSDVLHPKVYVKLPNAATCTTTATTTCTRCCTNEHWPFDQLPTAARVLGTLPGQLTDPIRATRKENQIRSMLRCIIPLLPAETTDPLQRTGSCDESSTTALPTSRPFTIVDFGGGTGHLSIPLALLYPHHNVICVDLGRQSLNLLHHKARHCCCGSSVDDSFRNKEATTVPYDITCEMDHTLRATSISNLTTYFGPVHTFVDHMFHMAVALHLCGEATDTVLHLAGQKRVPAIIVAPCCVGKLSTTAQNPYTYQATGSNVSTVVYPQSSIFRGLIQHVDDWNALAEAADYGDTSIDYDKSMEGRNKGRVWMYQNSIRHMAKTLLETDRCHYLEETFGYTTALTQMVPITASPKNDIIIAFIPSPLGQKIRLDDTNEETIVAVTPRSEETMVSKTNEWSDDEEERIRQQLNDYIIRCTHDGVSNTTFLFPTGMGNRQRKLIHSIAATEYPNLRHWGVGKKNADKTVAVALLCSKAVNDTDMTTTKPDSQSK